MTDKRIEEVNLYVAPGKEAALAEEHEAEAAGMETSLTDLKEQMRAKLHSEAGRALYKMRKAVVEPVFGQIKEVRGFRRFSFRGLVAVTDEWRLICLTHNLLKLFGSGAAALAHIRAGAGEPVDGAFSSSVMPGRPLLPLVLCLLCRLAVGIRATLRLSGLRQRPGFVC